MKNNIDCKNISLTDHLNSKLNESVVNEGFLDLLGKLTGTGSQSQTNAAKKSFGLLGALAVKLGFVPEEDKLAKAISAQLEEAEKNANDRMQKYMDAKENAMIAKMQAKFQHKENQLTLANQKKVNAFNQKKAEFDRETKFWKSNKTSFTAAENEAYDAALDKSFNEMGDLQVPELEEMRTLYLKLAFDNDGQPRDLDAIKAYANGEGKDAFKRYNELAKKHGKKMLSAVTEMTDAGEYQTLMSDVFANADKEAKAKAEKEAAELGLKKYQENEKAVATVNAMTAEWELKIKTAQENIEGFEKLKSSYTDNETGFFKADGDGNLVLSDDLDASIATCMNGFSENPSEEEIEEIKKELKKKGLNDDVINEIVKTPEGMSELSREMLIDNAKTIMNEKKDSILKTATSKYKESKGMADSASSELGGMQDALERIKNGDFTDDDLSELTEDQKAALNKVKTIDKTDLESGRYDTTTDAGKTAKKEAEDAAKNATKAYKKFEHDRQALIEERKERIATLEQSNRFSTEIKRMIETEMQGVDPGETKDKDGNVGYMKDGKFIKRPSPKAPQSEMDEYNKGLNQSIMMNKIEKPEIQIQKTADGKFKVTLTENGETADYDLDPEKPEDAKSIAHYQAQLSLYAQNKSLANAQREKFFKDNIDKVFTKDADGKYKFSKEEFDKLSKEDQEMVAMIMEDPESFTEGLEDRGENASKFSQMMKDDGKSIKSFINNWEDDDSEDDEDTKELKNADDEIEEDDPENPGQKKKIKNPAKEWHKKKNKSTGKPTKNYYNKEGDGISPEEYKEKVQNYKERLAKKKNTATDQQSLNSTKANINESLSKYLKRSIV